MPFTQFTPSHPLFHPPQSWTGGICWPWLEDGCLSLHTVCFLPSFWPQPTQVHLYLGSCEPTADHWWLPWVGGHWWEAASDIDRHGHHCPLNRVRPSDQRPGRKQMFNSHPFLSPLAQKQLKFILSRWHFLRKRGSADSSILVALLLVLAGFSVSDFSKRSFWPLSRVIVTREE